MELQGDDETGRGASQAELKVRAHRSLLWCVILRFTYPTQQAGWVKITFPLKLLPLCMRDGSRIRGSSAALAWVGDGTAVV